MAKKAFEAVEAVDLAVETFLILRREFFDANRSPIVFLLPDKGITQDDPFDSRVLELLRTQLPGVVSDGLAVKTSPPRQKGRKTAKGTNTTPDIVAYREMLCQGIDKSELAKGLTRILGVEVKKIERTEGGAVARASGMDYNTTPPCGVVRVYDASSQPIDIRAFYLFVCLESPEPGKYKVTAMCLCDGHALNQDFAFYLKITGIREKSIGLGTYQDGADRQRPMLIFANPLGTTELDKMATIIHPSAHLEEGYPNLKLVYTLNRLAEEKQHQFFCYRLLSDVPANHSPRSITFLAPERTTETQQRSRFFLPFSVTDMPPLI